MNPDLSRTEKPAAGASTTRAQKSGTSSSPIRSRELFGTGRQLVIEHSGHLYLLRITQNNKLILTK
ncbi:MAG: hemin uptake protein HemP [Steroidobacteraceae bacterium]